jgi:hypothetical protein
MSKELDDLKELRTTMLDAARDTVGIFPQARMNADGAWEYRTPWQDGWNAALIALFDRTEWLTKWFVSLPDATRTIVLELLHADALFLVVRNEVVVCALNMNDTFGYGCSDGTDVPIDAWSIVSHVYRDYGHDGLTAWAAKQEGVEPIRERQTERYVAARVFLDGL